MTQRIKIGLSQIIALVKKNPKKATNTTTFLKIKFP
jgi:hypothetical protein